MNGKIVYEVVTKLIGPIDAVGEHNTDTRRLDNLTELITLADKLLFDISMAAKDKDRPEDSMRKIGQKADRFLREVREADNE
jgi:hypothetical protein